MSLTISAKFREDLNLDISSTLFTDYPTIGEMKKHFSQYETGGTSVVDSVDSVFPTPRTALSSSAKNSPAYTETDLSSIDDRSIGLRTPAHEMGSGIEKVIIKANVTEVETGIPNFRMTNSTIDIQNTTIDVHEVISDRRQQHADVTTINVDQVSTLTLNRRSLPPSPDAVSEKFDRIRRDISHLPPANSVLLQNSARSAAIATKKLFLLPDGSGSATSYVSIPNLSPDIKVYGLNCPFMKKPEDFSCSVETVTALYLAEIRRRQPTGPYMIGGWSAGGVLAYEAARQLVESGDEVERLLLLDAPCPVALDPLPARLHIFFDQIGLLGTGKPGGTPGWLLPHFAASIKALSDYEPIPFAKGKAPRTVAIWCTDGVCKHPDDPRPPPAEDEDPAPMKWLLNNRTDFGDNGWAQLVGNNMEYYVMGGNHFSMMKPPHSETLGKYIRMGLSCTNT
jgi:thioesterase domain-containing protein